ncbi:hypothetical protein ACKZDW_23035 [Ralstonia syzygii subsp. celebesensis]|uniref:Hypothethical protein n=2 Tax=Ralstonia solanacearum species complex TaxID=3116862 RepID=G2ZRK8_9RALS|nr:hypothetical protein [Ralstonia syzygii]CBJ34721.1 hypothethical protein [Ralstonia solanacearum PSI07]CCA81684.1 hypothethical protein [blood disease bacterium R229]
MDRRTMPCTDAGDRTETMHAWGMRHAAHDDPHPEPATRDRRQPPANPREGSMHVLLTGTIRRAVGDHFCQAPLDGRAIGCFVIAEAVDTTGDATRPPPQAPLPAYRPSAR